jgi:hypothetical protein
MCLASLANTRQTLNALAGRPVAVQHKNEVRHARSEGIGGAETDNRRLKQQYWTVPGEPEWLAIQYQYTRRP